MRHFVLWSVGRDGQDNGGDARSTKPDRQWRSDNLDWVWPEPATAEEIAEAEAKRRP